MKPKNIGVDWRIVAKLLDNIGPAQHSMDDPRVAYRKLAKEIYNTYDSW